MFVLIPKILHETKKRKSNTDFWHNFFVNARRVLKGWNLNIEGENKKRENLLVSAASASSPCDAMRFVHACLYDRTKVAVRAHPILTFDVLLSIRYHGHVSPYPLGVRNVPQRDLRRARRLIARIHVP
jgi:hypothetical protein